MDPRGATRPPLRLRPWQPALRAVVALALAGSGCAGLGAQSGGMPAAASVARVLLFPLNVVVPAPPGLESALPFVDGEIRSYVESYGRLVESPAPDEAMAEWLASAQALRAEVGPDEMSFEGAAALLVRRLRAGRSFDALVLPWIALRPAKVRGRTVTWDGVTRRLRVINPEGRSLNVLKDFQAEAAAPSLQLAVFASDGSRLFEGVGGLDLVHALVLEGKPTRIDAERIPRAQIFSDRSTVHEGIAVAFDPFLPRR